MPTRRTFMQVLGGAAAAAGLPWIARAQQDDATKPASDRLGTLLPRRPLGRAGEPVTILGFGGAHQAQMSESAAQAQFEVALEEGVRFFDSAEQYGQGRSERYYGQHLSPKYRDIAFLMTKSDARTAEQARQDLDASLQRMATDHLDLWQIHALRGADDVDQRIDNGVLDVFLQAKQEGKARYIGFTGHDDYRSHMRMLDRLSELGVELDTCQMPVNVLDPHHESYVQHVLPRLTERGYGVLAMKTLAFGKMLGRDDAGWRRKGGAKPVVPEAVSLADALGWVWAQPVATLVSGTEKPAELRENARLARAFTGMSSERQQEILAATKPYAGPTMEFYKSA